MSCIFALHNNYMDLLSPSFVMQSHSDSAVSDHCYCQVQNKQGEGHLVFSRFLQTPPHLLIFRISQGKLIKCLRIILISSLLFHILFPPFSFVKCLDTSLIILPTSPPPHLSIFQFVYFDPPLFMLEATPPPPPCLI